MKHSTFTIHHLLGRTLLTAAILFVMALTCSAQDKRYYGDGPDDVLRFVPMLTAYKNLGFDIKDYPNAYAQYANEITLPLYSTLTEEDVERVCGTLKAAL